MRFWKGFAIWASGTVLASAGLAWLFWPSWLGWYFAIVTAILTPLFGWFTYWLWRPYSRRRAPRELACTGESEADRCRVCSR